ncbi:MAG: CDP-glycerol--poly(glycerophosphate) glycerophosphotransferase [Acidobacteria bacterium]|nr:MAG: CDP-glycerol--poly(glycerophosphate) glycerophosphotransferase [Acidobacteriota bacterium]
MKVFFDVKELYYTTQYLPVFKELKKRGVECKFGVYRNPDFNDVLQQVVEAEGIDAVWIESEKDSLAIYVDNAPDWIFFGNSYPWLNQLPGKTRSIQLGHGVGPKMSYYTKSDTPMDVRFVEGDRRYQKLQEMYPKDTFVQVGFAKLDPLINGDFTPFDLQANGLDPSKKTLLYAPTFYPSSLELVPRSWPDEFAEYNLIVKPHFFSIAKARYAAQRERIDEWRKASNVYIARKDEHSLLPFMATADLLISEASSSLFEFAALDKPIIWCDFLKLRWTYRGPLRYRFERRMDQDIKNYRHLGAHVGHYRELKKTVREQLSTPAMFHKQRREITAQLVGRVDGKASSRIADYLQANS